MYAGRYRVTACVGAIALLHGAAGAQTALVPSKVPEPLATGILGAGAQEKAQSRKTLTGDWGGLRSRLADAGLLLAVGYKGELAWNPRGGDRRDVTEVGQLDLGVGIDLEKAIGLEGGSFQSDITKRHGHSLNLRAGLDFLQEPQETYGRGQTTRWTQFWYQQVLAKGHVIFKLGRLPGGEFNNWGCDFTSLGLCGSQVGTTNTYLWYNFPVSQWAGWVRVRNDRMFVHLGANESNPRNLDTDFFLGKFHGARGVQFHAEGGVTPHIDQDRPGFYQVGGWYDTRSDDDALYDRNGGLAPLTGQPAARRDGQHGVYAQFNQQVTGKGTLDPITGILTPERGLTVGFNYTHGDRRTATTIDEIATGMLWTAPVAARPHDQIGLAFGRSRYNPRAATAVVLRGDATERPHAEYRAELYYRVFVVPGLYLRPDCQYVADPGGYAGRRDAVVLGLRGDVVL